MKLSIIWSTDGGNASDLNTATLHWFHICFTYVCKSKLLIFMNVVWKLEPFSLPHCLVVILRFICISFVVSVLKLNQLHKL